MPFLLRVELPDVPGSLGRLAGAIGEAGGDIEAIEIVEKRDGTAVDDVLLEIAPGTMPDSVVSAVNGLDGVRVVWISRYAAGGNLFLDLEAVEELTADPEGALDRLIDLLPVTFRADWAARVSKIDGIVYTTEAAPSELSWVQIDRAEPIDSDDENTDRLRRAAQQDRDRRHRSPRRPGVPRLRDRAARPPGRPGHVDLARRGQGARALTVGPGQPMGGPGNGPPPVMLVGLCTRLSPTPASRMAAIRSSRRPGLPPLRIWKMPRPTTVTAAAMMRKIVNGSMVAPPR